MKSDLDQLIEYYANQKFGANEQLQECLLLRDYLGAHHYSKELDLIEAELLKLHAFNGNLYKEELLLNNLISNIDYLKSKLKYRKDFWENKIEEKKNEVEQLRKEKAKFFTDSQEIDNALFDLYENKCKVFDLIFEEKYSKLEFNFKLRIDSVLIISVLDRDNSTAAILNKYHVPQFKKLGFQISNDEFKLIYYYDMNNFKNAVELKKLLSAVLYDIYQYPGFESGFIQKIY